MSGTWYNEIDPEAAETLRHLMEEGVIARGVVDERPIQEVEADDLRGYAQCHFFAGIGVWSYALKRAGWADDRPVWTGSCPCQPFSAAGKQAGFGDPRHLWPWFFRLIAERRPDCVFGEQSANAGAWIDLVRSDLESIGYAFGAPDLPAAGFGGSHTRQRFDWVADANNAEWWSERAPRHFGDWPQTGRIESNRDACERGAPMWVDHPAGPRHERALPFAEGPAWDEARMRLLGAGCGTDWVFGRDGKWRPIEPGIEPLAVAPPARLRRLRLYGNALDAEQTENLIAAYMACAPSFRVAA